MSYDIHEVTVGYVLVQVVVEVFFEDLLFSVNCEFVHVKFLLGASPSAQISKGVGRQPVIPRFVILNKDIEVFIDGFI